MSKPSKIDAYFKRKNQESTEFNSSTPSNAEGSSIEVRPLKSPRMEITGIGSSDLKQGMTSHDTDVFKYIENDSSSIDLSSLERDPGLRHQIVDYPLNKRDEIRRAYIKLGPYQPKLKEYPRSGEKHPRSFQASWFMLFPTWLEYSPAKDAAYCLPCYLFKKNSSRQGSNAFTVEGFCSWKKVNDGKNCALLSHIGKDPNSPHREAEQACRDLMNKHQHIGRMVVKQDSSLIENNRLRLKTSIDAIRWLTFQSCAFRGNDEGIDSKNRENFIELLKLLASYNEKVNSVVLENAQKNAKYTSPQVQKEILQIIANKVQKAILEEIGGAKFCIIVDEARDESKREQMAIVLRFVDKEGFVRERFFDLVHVSDTSALTLKNGISGVLSHHGLLIENIRGQGYDGASNMRGEWNGLQALFLKDCPYAYYIHCMAHRLQLALVAASREVIPVHQFFSNLTFIINIVVGSTKRHDELQAAQAADIAHRLEVNELETGRGLNQIGTLQRAGETRWSSHLSSIVSLLKMFKATCTVLENIINNGTTYAQRGDADAAYNWITSFEFIFILHLMRELMGMTDNLCQALQRQSQDILNAMNLVSTTKVLIQNFRDDGWSLFFEKVESFCKEHKIEIPDMNARYTAGRGRMRNRQDHITIEHHYRIDIFVAAIDTQLQELNYRFNEHMVELLRLSLALDPADKFKAFNDADICRLVEEFYPEDFTEQEKTQLRYELLHYKLDVSQDSNLQNLTTISELSQVLFNSKKSQSFPLVDRLLRLVLTLPISTATTERAFSAMKIVKTRLRNKMEDEFLRNFLIVYIEKEIAQTFCTDSIIDEFDSLKERRVALK